MTRWQQVWVPQLVFCKRAADYRCFTAVTGVILHLLGLTYYCFPTRFAASIIVAMQSLSPVLRKRNLGVTLPDVIVLPVACAFPLSANRCKLYHGGIRLSTRWSVRHHGQCDTGELN